MRLLTVSLISFFLINSSFAEINERPIKLNDQNNEVSGQDESYFPPATEPYSSPMVERYRVERQGIPAPQETRELPPAQSQVSSYNSNTSFGGHAQNTATPYPATRDVLEAAADKCDEELAMLWQHQNELEPYRRPHFQKCIGEAKVRCDALKKLVIAIKRADEQLFSYQQAVKNAQAATAG